jgi:hypothetical protein
MYFYQHISVIFSSRAYSTKTQPHVHRQIYPSNLSLAIEYAIFVSRDKHVPVATVNASQKKMEEAGNDSETHIYKNRGHGLFHISKGGRPMFEDVLTKTDAFLVKRNHLSGKDNIAEWTRHQKRREAAQKTGQETYEAEEVAL